jgi:hypothetical protein
MISRGSRKVGLLDWMDGLNLGLVFIPFLFYLYI